MSTPVGSEAPSFTATAAMPDDSLEEAFSLGALRGRYVALFFYPLDFSFVCPTEVLAFHERLEEFGDRDCEVVGVSVDSPFTHLAWRRTPVEEGGVGRIGFPLVSDLTKEIARQYGVLHHDGTALRATFLLDREGVVRHQVVNDPGLGRSVGDLLRTLDALRRMGETGQLCPANWEEGKEAIDPSPAGVVRYLQDFGPEL